MFRPILQFAACAVLIWLIPIVVSFAFYTREGVLWANFWLFKAVMALTLVMCCTLLFRWFYDRNPELRHARWPLVIGIGAAAISVVFDLLTIVSRGNMSLAEYGTQVLPVYLLIVLVCVSRARATPR